MAVRFQIRGGTSTEWSSHNPILMNRELGIETDTKKIKIGDGVNSWNELSYMTQGQKGKSIEFDWNGTQLGVRLEGQTSYEYVNLKGVKGDKGDPFVYSDFTQSQLSALRGPQGKSLEFNWQGTQLGIRVEGESSYVYEDVQGIKGDIGNGLEFAWDGNKLGVREKGTTIYTYSADLKGPKGDTGEISNLDKALVESALGFTINKSVPSDADFNNTQVDVVDNLTTNDATKALSAKQGVQLKQSVSDGKSLIATAITDMGVPTSSSDIFQVMASNIRQIESGGVEIATGTHLVSDFRVHITGLGFRPTLVAWVGGNAFGVFDERYSATNYKTSSATTARENTLTTDDSYMDNDGFRFRAHAASGTIYWIAIKELT